jgi:hypothetical protein
MTDRLDRVMQHLASGKTIAQWLALMETEHAAGTHTTEHYSSCKHCLTASRTAA